MTNAAGAAIRLWGVRHNNLKNFDLDLATGQLIVVTGLSGSGKSSLAFDTLFAEGQRRYIETFSPYARQFFDRMDKPQVDRIEGMPPAIAIEQRNSVKSTRSTVGTMTELCEYMKLLWPQLAQLHCQVCHQPVRPEPPAAVWAAVSGRSPAERSEVLVTFDLPLTEKLSLDESIRLVGRQGYQRLLVEGQVLRLEECGPALSAHRPTLLTVVQDRIRVASNQRARFVEACEAAYRFGKGRLTVRQPAAAWLQRFSQHLHCAGCDIEYQEPTSALFSFNHPIGACPNCRGFGRIITIDYARALPDPSRTLAQGAIKPWQTGHGLASQKDLLRACKKRRVPTDVPFQRLPKPVQEWVMQGDPDYGKDDQQRWPRAWYGVKGYFRWLESKAYKMHVRVLLSRYRAYTACPDCKGHRFRAESLLYRVTDSQRGVMTLADFYRLSVSDALDVVDRLVRDWPRTGQDPVQLALREVRSRLGYLHDVGLGYLTLDRPTRTLSGGETERVNLTSCLGTRLVNTLYVLDEPSVGLHPRDTDRLIKILHNLRDLGNTVVVVEHEASVMRAADSLVDLGPGHGESGGELVFQGSYEEVLRCERSLTGRYLSGRTQIDVPLRRPVDLRAGPTLVVEGARRHNLQDLKVEIPLRRLVALTGVSGSGKTTLAREVLLPLLQDRLSAPDQDKADSEDEPDDARPGSEPGLRLSGHEHLAGVLLVDQSALGRTPRSNPAVYTGAFDDIRELFAQSELARQQGLSASAFSFNSAQGQCERCRGAGFEKIEMQFLSDVFVKCPECDGRRYRPHILEVKLNPPQVKKRRAGGGWSIAAVLEATVDEVVEWIGRMPESAPARRALHALELLQQVGLGYLRLGQPVNTLSGGESQRLKLVKHLATFRSAPEPGAKTNLFVFDEPTTGLHVDDVRVLVMAMQRLVEAGQSLLVIEHNLDLIGCTDWVLDLGPEAGDGGGRLVAAGTPETVAGCAVSHTGYALAGWLAQRNGGRS